MWWFSRNKGTVSNIDQLQAIQLTLVSDLGPMGERMSFFTWGSRVYRNPNVQPCSFMDLSYQLLFGVSPAVLRKNRSWVDWPDF